MISPSCSPVTERADRKRSHLTIKNQKKHPLLLRCFFSQGAALHCCGSSGQGSFAHMEGTGLCICTDALEQTKYSAFPEIEVTPTPLLLCNATAKNKEDRIKKKLKKVVGGFRAQSEGRSRTDWWQGSCKQVPSGLFLLAWHGHAQQVLCYASPGVSL